MTKEDTGIPIHHTAAFSAGFLQSRYPVPAVPPENADLVIVRENGVYVQPGNPPALFFSQDLRARGPGLVVRREQYLGHRGSIACYAVEAAPELPVPGGIFYPDVRKLFGIIPDAELAVAALAVRIIGFDRTTRFCGQCSAEMRQSRDERAKVCDTCGRTVYPCTSPAIIVLIQRDDRILLASSPRFPPGLYSIIAGFVEPGETLEEAVHREVREETGLEITNIRYLGSEPWPFPNSLMIGFVADYAGGEIVIDNNEIIAAGWFDRDHLPMLPRNMSIARALVDWWIAKG